MMKVWQKEKSSNHKKKNSNNEYFQKKEETKRKNKINKLELEIEQKENEIKFIKRENAKWRNLYWLYEIKRAPRWNNEDRRRNWSKDDGMGRTERKIIVVYREKDFSNLTKM